MSSRKCVLFSVSTLFQLGPFSAVCAFSVGNARIELTSFGSEQGSSPLRRRGRTSFISLKSSQLDENDPNRWSSSLDKGTNGSSSFDVDSEAEDWEEMLKKREQPETWSAFESANEKDLNAATSGDGVNINMEDEEEAWLKSLQAVSAEEVAFNIKENERADTARQMQEWGFTSEAIQGALGVAVDDSLEKEEDEKDAALIDNFRRSNFGLMLDDDIDLSTVESHTMVDKDEETGEPIRSQMVYVDEHTCIGCTNCATIASNTFFMEDEMGRARVFSQWGDDDETIKIAIETCPVDCIHYVPYEELVSLEKQRRSQMINFKARLVNQGEYGGGVGHRVGGATMFTDAPLISGNMGSRCNNCPSAGCKNCPMYGVGENPEFKRKEELRKKRRLEKQRQQALDAINKRADL